MPAGTSNLYPHMAQVLTPDQIEAVTVVQKALNPLKPPDGKASKANLSTANFSDIPESSENSGWESAESPYQTRAKQDAYLSETEQVLDAMVARCVKWVPPIKGVNDVLSILRAKREFVGLASAKTQNVTVNVINMTVGALRTMKGERAIDPADLRKSGGKRERKPTLDVDLEPLNPEP